MTQLLTSWPVKTTRTVAAADIDIDQTLRHSVEETRVSGLPCSLTVSVVDADATMQTAGW